METGEVSEKIKRGKHTTRHSELIYIGEDTYLMDTPGFSSLFLENIEKEDLKHIFERLYKCDKGRSEKGSGLGLSITHQLVEKMNGTITAKSVHGKGTEFILLFPLVD